MAEKYTWHPASFCLTNRDRSRNGDQRYLLLRKTVHLTRLPTAEKDTVGKDISVVLAKQQRFTAHDLCTASDLQICFWSRKGSPI